VIGRLGDMFGKQRLIVVQMVLFTVGAIICGLAQSLVPLLIGRAVMGSALALFPLTFSLLRDILPVRRVPSAVALISAIVGMGAAAGQATGGLITDTLGYHWVFWLATLMGALSVVLVIALVPESPDRAPGRVDVIGAALLGLALAGPLIAVSETPAWGWISVKTLGLTFVGLAFAVAFVAQERRHPEPLAELATLRSRPVALTNLATVLVGFAMFGASVIITQFLQEPTSTGYGFGASPAQAGLFLVPGYLASLAVAPLAGRISLRVGARMTLILGCASGFTALVLLVAAHGQRFELYAWPVLLYAGTGLAFGAMPTLILQTVPRALSGQSTAFNMIARNIGSSLGTQLAATFITASVLASGLPAEIGYTHAFLAEATAAGLALLVALAIPRPARAVWAVRPQEEVVEAAAEVH
jgi:MFS family permease